ncbi:hypothetical protein GH714_017474 [Hevea brasiliensis]|uniref:Protein kinase domain-containing protein n=1 Tax=Hevea brasiliensis TaxID=3981 RepID=A0A6A6LUS8_HEVBR|nr:hypothetical protein GH714_017474 [Hevea brasiliensis]
MRCSCFGAKGRADGAHRATDGNSIRDINHFSYNELRSATDDFHSTNKIGRGGFGTVYKGTLKSGRQVAVKTLSAQSKQGVREFLNEITIISKVRHPNLVELIGCCAEGTNRILVYEYVENNSLDHALLVADLDNYSVVVLSREIPITKYALGGQLTMKADVYSFGVLILEIISGKSSTKASWGEMQKLLLEWAWQLHEEGKLLEIVDPEMGDFPEEEVVRYIKVAFFCTQGTASRRPLMSQVVDMLSRNIRLNEKLLSAPGFFQDSVGVSGPSFSTKKSSADSSTSNQMSSVPVTITEVTPR